MQESRLLKLLSTLSKDELKGLRGFIRSPFANKRREVVALFDILEKPLRSGKTIPDKQVVYRQVFPGAAYDDHRIRMAMSFLFQATGQFLAVREFMEDKPLFQRRLSGIFRQRQLPDLFIKTWEEAGKQQAQQPGRNADFFEGQYQLSLEKYRFDVDNQSADRIDFQDLSDQLDRAFLARKLWQACFMLSHQTVRHTHYDFGLLNNAVSYLEKTGYLDVPAISVYYYCWRSLIRPGEKTHFQHFKKLLMQNGDLFPGAELRDLYLLAINFCIRRYNEGSQDYLPEQFELYREGFSKGYFISDGALSRYTYQNAATIGLVLRELEWVERFVHEYRPYLREEYREGLFSFNLARLEYQRRELGKALLLLQKAEYKDLLLNLAAKTLQLKIFYELQEFDTLESHLQAIRTFIRRKKVMGYHRENYLNTVHFTQKILESRLFDKKERAALRREISETGALAEKEWLLAMIAE